jgi:hypothetical protein
LNIIELLLQQIIVNENTGRGHDVTKIILTLDITDDDQATKLPSSESQPVRLIMPAERYLKLS